MRTAAPVRSPLRCLAAVVLLAGCADDVAETSAEAYELYREPAEYFYNRCLHIDPRFAAPPGYATEATQRAGLQSQVSKAASYSSKFNTLAREMDAIVDNGYVIIGSKPPSRPRPTRPATADAVAAGLAALLPLAVGAVAATVPL